jgi:hypothetical protein
LYHSSPPLLFRVVLALERAGKTQFLLKLSVGVELGMKSTAVTRAYSTR